ncbi:MAG TPA: ribosome small subunit-dependent GTPase A [Anaerolineales bacterium]|nr:ribosome small subunit-dependent GTPase A [Anaerolineales bacterium]
MYKKTIGNYTVHAGGRAISCSLSSRLQKPSGGPKIDRNSPRRAQRGGHPVKDRTAAEPIDLVAVGDRVRFIAANDGSGKITEVLPRRNKLARKTAVPMPSARSSEQVIVANIDQVVPVFAAANPAPKWNLLDRYLVSAESAGLAALVCITKLDLVQAENDPARAELWLAVEEYRQSGYPIFLTSAATGEGLDQLKQALQGRISVFLGKSGVGKTSLLNALQPGLGLRVNEVSQVTGKGKHTTTHLEMFPLEFGDAAGATGGAIVDTPGVREFGLWDVDEDDLALFFPEMRPYIGRCRFGLDCKHDEEPGCAVRTAVTAGRISPRRYQSYLRLRLDA